MKILKLPIETRINCDCGCEFEFDMDDIEHQGIVCGELRVYTRAVIDCPFCHKRHTLQEEMIDREKGDIKNEC